MHYLTLALLHPDTLPEEIDQHVEQSLEPYGLKNYMAIERLVLDEADFVDDDDDDLPTEYAGTFLPPKIQAQWDYWYFGGCFTGSYDRTYDPTTDLRNVGPCELCELMAHLEESNAGRMLLARLNKPASDMECGRCSGTGIAFQLPSEWVRNDTDIFVVKAILPQILQGIYPVPAAIVTPEPIWHTRVIGDDAQYEEWKSTAKKILTEYRECIAVVVNCHF